MAAKLVSRLPLLAARAQANAATTALATAKAIAAEAQANAPDAPPLGVGLVESINAKMVGPTEARVNVGAFYGLFLEYGTEKMGARPFLTPAAEAKRGPFVAAVGRRIVK
jgi:HK97 gp10 family phage protein